MLYRAIKPLASFATRQFFNVIHRVGAKPCEEGPLVVVANHPSVMMDGLLVCDLYQRPLWTVAKSTLFLGGPITWLLRSLHLIPIHRRQDSSTGEVSNEAGFREVCDRLRVGGAVLIFPEGQSKALRKILPVKTGAARICFQAEVESGFSLGLRVQAVGITYADFTRRQSSVTIAIGEPILLSDYQSAYEVEPANAVRQLSKAIESELKQLTANVEDTSHQALVEKIGKVYRSRDARFDDRVQLGVIARNVERLLPEHQERALAIEKRIDLYLQLSSVFKIDGSASLDTKPVFQFLLAPLTVVGAIMHYVPYQVTKVAAAWWAGHRSQVASWGLALGFFLFPAWYLALYVLFLLVTKSALTAFLVIVGFAVSGYVANRYLHQLMLHLFSALWPGKRSPIDVLRLLRDDIIAELESARVE